MRLWGESLIPHMDRKLTDSRVRPRLLFPCVSTLTSLGSWMLDSLDIVRQKHTEELGHEYCN